MTGELLAGLIDDRATVGHRRIALRHERRIVVIRDEADLLAVRLVRDVQRQPPRLVTHFGLGQGADGKHGAVHVV